MADDQPAEKPTPPAPPPPPVDVEPAMEFKQVPDALTGSGGIRRDPPPPPPPVIVPPATEERDG